MAADYLRLLREAIEGNRRIADPIKRPNRTLLSFQGGEEMTTMLEAMTALATGIRARAQWGATTNYNGGNFLWNLGEWG